ncbi:calcium-binding protein [Pseudomonas sp. RA_15y_Pfl2_54]|uniref:calcium-binding protein n=1 Tax=Pseudomonas sp. RA_15y_Pfl2_54 TaxID=3088704 RepID=UPI0030DB7CAE
MATPFQDASIHHDAVIITELEPLGPNQHTDSTLDLNSETANGKNAQSSEKTSQLKINDRIFGPIEIGPISVTRVSLAVLGARIDGQPLNGTNTFFRVPKRSFINSLQFSLNDIESIMKSATGRDSYLLPDLLFEMASRRPITSARLIREDTDRTDDAGKLRSKLEKLLNSAHKLDLRHANLPKNPPHWISKAWSNFTLGSSVGIQAFGIFMGIRGLYYAYKAHDSTELKINGAGLLAEVGSIITDVTITQEATRMLKAGQNAFKDFAKTRTAIRLSRSGGLVGGALTLPFDITTAVRSFIAAENATGKAAMDLYVSGGLSVASGAMTIILGSAAMAGFSAAGPVGLAAGALMAFGSQVYAAVRIVDDIDDYIELTVEERWRTGWFAFCFMDPDEDVHNRFLSAKAKIDHAKQLKQTARALLDVQLKDTTEAVVNGSFDVELEPTLEGRHHWLTRKWERHTVMKPKIKDGNDIIDGRNGVTAETPGAELGIAGAEKSILWFIGGGDDSIEGVEKKPNAFYYGAGNKQLTGGEKDDFFVFQGAKINHQATLELSDRWTLKGGAGDDSLILGRIDLKNHHQKQPQAGYDVDLPAGTVHAITADSATESGNNRIPLGVVESIENVETVAHASSTVTGTPERNVIKAHGADIVRAGAGNDIIQLLASGAEAWGDAGADEYFVAHVPGQLSITEDGKENSIIELGCRKDLIDGFEVRADNSLWVTLNFDMDDSPKTRVVIHDVYEEVANKRQLKNKTLTFVTKDGYHLTPDLPETITYSKREYVKAVITRQGSPIEPTILYTPDCFIEHQRFTGYYLPRTDKNIIFRSVKRPKEAIKLYLDYASTELTKVEVSYGAFVSQESEIDIQCDLIYTFDEKTLTLRNFSSFKLSADMGFALQHMREHPNQQYLFIFNDGLMANAGLTTTEEPSDYKTSEFMRWKHLIQLPLRYRRGKYPFELPENEPYKLSSGRACAKFSSHPAQTAMESLEGEGGTYFLHLVANMTIKISTPGGLASARVRLSHSSTWYIDATALGTIEIKLTNNKLYIGSCTVHLPVYEDSADIIDRVYVTTEEGIIRTVDLSFDQIAVSGIDARYFVEPPAYPATLPDSQALLGDHELPVLHAQLYNHPDKRVFYSFPGRHWFSRPSTASTINRSDLVISARCDHKPTAPVLSVSDQLSQVPVA